MLYVIYEPITAQWSIATNNASCTDWQRTLESAVTLFRTEELTYNFDRLTYHSSNLPFDQFVLSKRRYSIAGPFINISALEHLTSADFPELLL